MKTITITGRPGSGKTTAAQAIFKGHARAGAHVVIEDEVECKGRVMRGFITDTSHPARPHTHAAVLIRVITRDEPLLIEG